MWRRRIVRRFAVVAAALAVVVALAPGLIAGMAAGRISRSVGTDVRLGWLSWNPFTGRWTVRGLRVAADRGPAAFAARRLTARVSLWDVIHGRYRVESIELDRARVRLRATADGWTLPLPRRDATEPHDGSAASNFSLEALDAPRAVIRLEPHKAKSFLVRLRQLHVAGSVDGDRTGVRVWTRGRLDRAPLELAGRMRAAGGSHRYRLRLATTGLDLGRTLTLAGPIAAPEILGRADVVAKYDEGGPAGAVKRTASGRFTGHDVTVRRHGLDGVRIRRATVSRFGVDLGERRLSLGDLRLRDPEIWVRRTGAQVAVAGIFGDEEGTTGTEDAPAWAVTVASTNVAGGTLHHVDAASGEETLDLTLDQADAGPLAAPGVPVPFSVAAALKSGGRITVRGDLVREPLAARAHADLTGIVLPPLLTVAGAPLRLESGEATGSFDVAFASGAVEGSGTLTVADVKTISPDDARPEDVMAFKDARLVLRRAQTQPPSAILDAVEINWPYVLVDRTAAGIFPLSLASNRPTAPAGSPPSIRVGRLNVLGGRIDFRDTTLDPPYWRALASLDLDARRVEVPSLRVGSLRAKGLVDEISPLRVEGTIGSRTRLVAEVDRLDLLPFNAYLAGAAPYVVSSGAVNVRSEITFERSQLEVNNQIVLSRLGLSGTEGEDFVKRELGIPLTLALALMKDYRGNIALALPFGGDLKQPTFEMRSVVLQAIVSAIRGAVLSPLNALGRVLVSDGRIEQIELDAVPFPPGGRQLDEAGRERLMQVARVLQTHPDLGVRFRGLAAAADVERIQDEAALSALVNADGAEPLRAFLRARLTGRAPTALDRQQKARLDALLASLPWPDATLHELAVDRGSVAVASVVVDHKVDPERVEAEVPRVPGPEQLAPTPGASVELHEH